MGFFPTNDGKACEGKAKFTPVQWTRRFSHMLCFEHKQPNVKLWQSLFGESFWIGFTKCFVSPEALIDVYLKPIYQKEIQIIDFPLTK